MTSLLLISYLYSSLLQTIFKNISSWKFAYWLKFKTPKLNIVSPFYPMCSACGGGGGWKIGNNLLLPYFISRIGIFSAVTSDMTKAN